MRINLQTLTMTPAERDEAALTAELQAVQARENPATRVAAAPKWKDRPDITPERKTMHLENRALPASQVLAKLKTELHEAWLIATVCGKWIWLEFPKDAKPHATVCAKLYDLGFHFNWKRKAWQNPCSAFIGHSKSDPRLKYLSAKASELEGAVNITDAPAKAEKRELVAA
jgi:hypothetical protein